MKEYVVFYIFIREKSKYVYNTIKKNLDNYINIIFF